MVEPEFESIEAFIEHLLDDERNSFSPGEAQKVSKRTGIPLSEVMKELVDFGFRKVVKEVAREVRGVMSNPNGTHPFQANPTFTTPGSDSIIGFAGREGN